MAIDSLKAVTTLTFDVFGTALDLIGSLFPPTRRMLLDE